MNIGRNDDCHCGSGKKYKKCHLEADEKAKTEALAKANAAAAAAAKESGEAAPSHAKEHHGHAHGAAPKAHTTPLAHQVSVPRRTGGG